MDNKSFENFMNQDFKGFSEWLNTLDPYEFTIIATLIGFAIAPFITTSQQNSLGNFFEQLGQTLETISAQGQTINTLQQNNQQANNFNSCNDDINNLKLEIERLKRKIDN